MKHYAVKLYVCMSEPNVKASFMKQRIAVNPVSHCRVANYCWDVTVLHYDKYITIPNVQKYIYHNFAYKLSPGQSYVQFLACPVSSIARALE